MLVLEVRLLRVRQAGGAVVLAAALYRGTVKCVGARPDDGGRIFRWYRGSTGGVGHDGA